MVSPDFFPVWSGIGTYLIELVKNLPPSIKLHLVTVDRASIPGSRKNVVDNVKNGNLDEIKGKVTIHNIAKAKGTFSYHLGFQAACFKKIPKLVREEKIDLLHTNFPLMSDIFLSMTKVVKIPKVATIHSTIEGQHFGVQRANFGAKNLEKSDLANSLLYYPLRFGEKIVAKDTKNFIAVSENIKNEFIHYMGIDSQRIRTIYNGIDINHYYPDGESEQIPGLIISIYWPTRRHKGHRYYCSFNAESYYAVSKDFFPFCWRREPRLLPKACEKSWCVFKQLLFLWLRK
jgi:glycosyltransferase involved in cell wall biosynthesis